ncbi:hypothetical protein MPNT_10278 [Candidatus Methylacidithermus pantelleriae]|uniref:Uncharacterized protein n=1 Tax=Candidatus Methylacidithermus pantelleriae TaxID=2744239 RepID=A0A8J2BHE6_9BACT|nr:hypothetical protein MPNT_10278 [Candidatus Methylacidithermus pantelleriae]
MGYLSYLEAGPAGKQGQDRLQEVNSFRFVISDPKAFSLELGFDLRIF